MVAWQQSVDTRCSGARIERSTSRRGVIVRLKRHRAGPLLVAALFTAAAITGGASATSANAAAAGPTTRCTIAHGRGSSSTPICSTGTVVVAKSNASNKVKVVGTSTITVLTSATVGNLRGQLTAKDHSKQTYEVTDASGNVKRSGTIGEGDRFVVTAEDGQHQFEYGLAIYDPSATERDGVYWNEDLYNEIDSTVNANTPVFPARYCDITDPRYASLVRQATETFATGNEANNPAVKTSPLVFSSQQVWYYGDAIAAASRDCHERGGGIVVVPAGGSRNANGAYYSGAIRFLSNVNLHVETGATVK